METGSPNEPALHDTGMEVPDWNSRAVGVSGASDSSASTNSMPGVHPYIRHLDHIPGNVNSHRRHHGARNRIRKGDRRNAGGADELRTKSIFASLAGFRASGKFSDLVIRCGDRDFDAHRVVVCSQSRFFDEAVTDWGMVGALSPFPRCLGELLTKRRP